MVTSALFKELTSMKLQTLGVLFSLLSLTILACEKETPPAEEAQPAQPAGQPAAAQAGAGGDAGAVCAGMVEAAKAKDMDKIIAVSTPGAAEALAPAGLKEGVLAALTGGSCSEVKVSAEDANRATVQVRGGEGAKELPFVKGADGWRFDVASYLSRNPAAAGDEAAQKGKRGAKKAEKAKKGGKKKGKKGK
jgi:hypothetical protein